VIILKIAIICRDFQKFNIRKLPWKYVYEIAKYLSNRHEIIVITDSNKKDIDGIEIISIKKLFIPLKGETEELLNVLEHENPDKCIMLLGLTSLLRREFKINKPVIGVFTSPIYSIRELMRNIGLKDSIKYRKYTTIHYINALIPNLFVKKWANEFEKIVFLSDYTQKKVISKGLDERKSFLIPLGLEEIFLELPETENVEKIKKVINPDNIPIILYFTSPLTLRGTDTLVRAFSKVRRHIPSKLIFLSRIDYKELLIEEKILKDVAKKENVLDSIEIISIYLNPEKIKEYLSAADIVVIPFKIVISDVPVSILEAMALKKPIISTSVASIPEILNGNGLIVNPNDSENLANEIIKLLNNKELMNHLINNSSEYIEKYPDWDFVGNKLSKIIE